MQVGELRAAADDLLERLGETSPDQQAAVRQILKRSGELVASIRAASSQLQKALGPDHGVSTLAWDAALLGEPRGSDRGGGVLRRGTFPPPVSWAAADRPCTLTPVVTR